MALSQLAHFTLLILLSMMCYVRYLHENGYSHRRSVDRPQTVLLSMYYSYMLYLMHCHYMMYRVIIHLVNLLTNHAI